MSQRIVTRNGIAEQGEIDTIGRKADFLAIVPACDQIVAQALANREHRVGACHHAVFERAGQAVFERAFPARAIAHRRILPEGADLVDKGQAESLRGAQTRHSA